ncbi:MAG: hypothetical protein EON54_18000 [Alcaligenaceae bacterium]|nr:MAG: hypothetical protein EON54_18000 [Alcaligenaceae bacterium]
MNTHAVKVALAADHGVKRVSRAEDGLTRTERRRLGRKYLDAVSRPFDDAQMKALDAATQRRRAA